MKYTLILLFLVSACTQKAPLTGASARSSSQVLGSTHSKLSTNTGSKTPVFSNSDFNSSSGSNTGSSSGSEGGSTSESLTSSAIDPATVAATIQANVALAPSDIVNDPNIVFPKVTIKKTTADYVQLLRCAASYSMLTLQGTNIQNNLAKLSANDKKWGWSQAINDSKNCQIVSEYLTPPTYVDMPAPSGSFYYVANPCVDAAHSTTGLDGCSYALSFTKPLLDYQNSFIDKIRNLSQQYAAAQSQLYADLDDVRVTAKLFELRLNLCDEYFAFTETEKSLQRGLIMLGLNILGAMVAAPIGGAGGAMMVGMLAQMMGGNILAGILNIQPGVNSCLYGTSMVSQEGLTTKKALANALASAKNYETKFNVAATLAHFTELVQGVDSQHPTGGIIAKDILRMQNIIAQMNAMDQTIVSVDSLIAQGNAYATSQVNAANSSTPIESLPGLSLPPTGL